MPRTMTKTAALILDGGDDAGMRSSIPKLLHPCAGVPLVTHVIRAAMARRCAPIVVVLGPGSTRVRELIAAEWPAGIIQLATRREPGMASGLAAGLEVLGGFTGRVLLLPADMPLVTPATLGRLQKAGGRWRAAALSAGDGAAVDSACLCEAELLREALAGLGRGKSRLDGRLESLVRTLASGEVAAVAAPDGGELVRVGTRVELGEAEAALRRRIIREHQRRGVTVRDPEGTFIDAGVRIERDVVLGVGVQLAGDVRIGKGARIEGPTVIKDTRIGAGAMVYAFCHLEGARVAAGASVGPFARLRTGARLEEGAKVGNFVEVKKSRLGKGAKANHLAYLGDAEIGARSNIGAGTITCNYDGGPVKHPTKLGEAVFVGSNSTLVAPLDVGRGAFVAAGSTLTGDVPAEALAFGRARQKNLEGYAPKLRARIAGKGKR